jgi:peptidyl-prolyl cis-trans isomerase C
MNKYTIPLCVMFVAGCSQSGNAPDTRPIQIPSDGQIAVIVNGISVPQTLLDAVARSRNLHLDRPDQREQALKLTTDLVLMAQVAKNDNLYADPQFQAEVEVARLKGVADAGMIALQKQTPVTDEILKTQYDSQVGQAGKFEYDFSQLLFANEDDALKAEGDLLAGKPFPQVFDAWRSKAKQAKAFSRVRLDQLPEALGKVLAQMKNGENTKVPVKTEFGWHVVHLDIANPFTPPPYDQVKEGIRRTMQVKIGQQRLEKLREQAKVEYPPGSTAPVSTKSETPKPAAAPETPAEKPVDATPEKKG